MTTALDTSDIDMDGKYSFTKAAGILGVDRSRVYRYADAGLIDYYYDAVGRRFVTGYAISEFWRRAFDPGTGRAVLLRDGRRQGNARAAGTGTGARPRNGKFD